MPVRFTVPLPGPFSYTARVRPSKTAGCLTQAAFWLLIGPFLIAFWAVMGAVWLVVAAVIVMVAIWRGIFTAIGSTARK